MAVKQQTNALLPSLSIPEHITEHCDNVKRHRGYKRCKHLRPAFVSNQFIQLSLSPCDRTCPQSANVVFVDIARPCASTSATTICTDAWSLEVMSRSGKKMKCLFFIYF